MAAMGCRTVVRAGPVGAANRRTMVVLNTGGPVEMPWVDQVPAIREAWFWGGETGHALANVLTGKVNPSGKLMWRRRGQQGSPGGS